MLTAKAAERKNQYARCITLIDKYPGLFFAIEEAIGPNNIDILLLLETHKTLMSLFIRSAGMKTNSLERAISKMGGDSILVYITELTLYGVFTPTEYLNFIKNVSTSVYENPDTVTYTPKQIILSGFPQKVIFVCNADENVIARIEKYCEQHFHSSIKTVKNGNKIDVIVQNPLVKNFEESQLALEKFMYYVSTQEKANYEELGLDIKKLMCTEGSRFISCALETLFDVNNVNDLINNLNGGHITININFGNNNNVIFGSGQITVKNSKDDTRKWILDHPPAMRELKKSYYSRYKVAIKNCVSDVIFGKLVSECGKYESYSSNGKNYWVAK